MRHELWYYQKVRYSGMHSANREQQNMWHANILKALKPLAFQVFTLAVKLLSGKRIGTFRPAAALYRYLARSLIPEQKRLVYADGHKMFVHMEGYKGDGIAQEVLFYGSYERYVTILFKELLSEGMNMVDIGANIGYYTLLAAKLVGERGKVFAFEPEPENYALLLRNIEVNGYKNCVPVRQAVSNKAGKVKLFLSKADPGMHSLYRAEENATEAITVDTISLDDFFKDKECPIDIIKVDVEGAEMAVLQGMATIIKNNENLKIFTEFYPALLQSSGFWAGEYWDKLMECGFKFIYLINEQKQRLEPADFASIMRFCKSTFFREPTFVNLLCTKSPLEVSNH